MGSGTMHERRNKRIMELGEKYWRKMQGETPSLFSSDYWQGRLLDQVLEDESLKVDAFRFIDVLPVLQTTEAVSSHISDYLLHRERGLPAGVRALLKMAVNRVTAPLGARAVRTNVARMARRFICENASAKAVQALRALADENLAFTADILGEATASDAESEQYLRRYLDLIELLGEATAQWPDNPLLYRSAAGELPRANISVKISAFDPFVDAADPAGSVGRLKERLLPLLRKAREKNVFINFDLEQWALHGITHALFEEVAKDPDLVDWPHMGLVLQAYLKTSDRDCDRLLDLSRERGTPFTVRLVKGAYWDYEVVHARLNGFACPVFTAKGLTDANYENLSVKLLSNHTLLTPAFASHNLRSLVHALVVAGELGVERNAFELQMLYGMAEPLRRVFAADGCRVRIYAPIGELLPGMAYLVRRLLENTSNSGFLKQSYHDGVAISTALEPPVLAEEVSEKAAASPAGIDAPFVNTGLLDFCEEKVRDRFAAAVIAMNNRFPIDVPMVVNGREKMTEEREHHVSPNDPGLEITRVSRASVAQAEDALQSALSAFPDWRDEPLQHRAGLLAKLADRLEEDRYNLAALQVHEVGKPWREADADVAEAIDFCRYYARQALRTLGPARQGDLPGEENILWYEGRGPVAVIAPWNFPLAILCGMTTASLVSGNTVLIKPATAASAVASSFYQHLLAAGFAPEVAHFLPGSGSEIGDYLVTHPAVAQIAFTGSREIGLEIIEKAAKTHPGQAEVKRVVCEMGGKNAIIVDEDADIDAALKGVLHSAFGYAGQKCSACSRLVLVGSVYDRFMNRFIDACRCLIVVPATDPDCRLGPVIDETAWRRLQALIDSPPDGAELLFRGTAPERGYFVEPTVFRVDDPANPMMQQEFFGPVLTVMKAPDFTTALDIANSTDFALTGGVYSRSPTHLALAQKRFKVGNLYINRGCTGAIVSRQPFGGFGMSGTGTKAGGPGYLRNFANPRCVTENTMRSGFTPELQL